MTIPKKGSRKIVVGTQNFRWTIRKKPTYGQEVLGDSMMKAAFELYENPGSVLSITFPWPRSDSISESKVSVTPKDIEFCIKSAISGGWQPGKPGSAFKYSYDKTT